MRRLALCLGLLLLALPAPGIAAAGAAQGIEAAAAVDTPAIDLYTMGPGDELFTRFGHAAICVTDSRTPWGRCYNYGTADFSTPLPLTWDFIRGRALFWVAVQDLPGMVASYERQDRTVYRQRLPLAPEQAGALRAALAGSTAEQVRYYRYHHFRDNCTTRIRDLLDAVSTGVLRRDAGDHRGPSFRELARRGFAGDAPLLLAVELILGRAADERTSPWQAMFLPEAFRAEVARRLGAAPVEIYRRRGPPVDELGPRTLSLALGRLALLGGGLLLAGLVLAAGARGGRGRRVALGLTGLVLGLIGTVLYGLAILSSFPELSRNEVLLVFLPTDLLLPGLRGRWLRGYLGLRLGGLALVGLGSLLGLLIQPLSCPIFLVAAPLLVAWRTERA